MASSADPDSLYTRIRVIGRGSYGEVWLVKHKKDKKQYVLKKMDIHNASKRERKAAEQEAKLLSKLRHPNIVGYKDSFQANDGFLYIAMGFCEGGDLYTRLKQQKGTSLEERQLVEWFVQIAMALQYLHERNILHRDLKTQNIFLTKSKIIKVGDLGIARVLDSASDMATTLIGTPYYMSPELFSNKPYNHKSDVWALGCCVYEMATLKHAFNAKDMNALVYKILRGKMPAMPKQYSPELTMMIKAMLSHNPDKRPSVNRILRDPYIKRNIAIFLEGTKKSSRPTSSGGRPKSSGGSSSRRTSDSVDLTDAKDSGRSSVSSVASVAIAPSLPNQLRQVDVQLEPLNVGLELDTIKEESLEGSGYSRRSSGSSQKNSSSKDHPSPSSGKSTEHVENCTPQDSRNWSKDPQSSGKSSERVVEGSISQDNRNMSESAVDEDKCHCDLDGQSDVPSQQSAENDENSSRAKSTRSVSDARPTQNNSARRKRKRHRLFGGANAVIVNVESRRIEMASAALPPKGSVLQSRSNAKSIPKHPKLTETPRPLPPGPSGTPVVSSNDPTKSQSIKCSQANESGYSSAVSTSSVAVSHEVTASGDRQEDTPRGANLSARARRRAKKDVETPRTSRSVDVDRIHRLMTSPEGRSVGSRSVDCVNLMSQQDDRQDDRHIGIDQPDASREKPNVAPVTKKPPIRQRQPSMPEDDSSSEEDEFEVGSTDGKKEKERKRKDQEMNNFICLLDTTLKLNKENDKSDEDKTAEEDAEEEEEATLTPAKLMPCNNRTYVVEKLVVDDLDTPDIGDVMTPEEEPTPVVNVSVTPVNILDPNVPMPARTLGQAVSLTTTGRLWERITMLRKDCIQGLGVRKLKEAYDILDEFEADELEPRLIALLGERAFDVYAGKIWQLKFCEEAAFGLV
ncbi:hypothetical protein NP493_249g12003 [Ridgeia piscesae]|uniref:Serine/threonine-protein kinase Nek4 n=1 Tax=Ridgeia piscesae TaxID=27915 RepID=A0AAD9NYL7_RIDPI|nr:hypothetical protein NP493_249g12003 [Ridgeia piscesae]